MVLIVGVGTGLGRAQAKRFAEGGNRVALVARKPDFIEPLAAEIGAKGGKAAYFVADASDESAVTNLFEVAEAALGPAEAVIINAGGQIHGGILDTDATAFENCWRGACMMAFLTGQAAAQRMVACGAGTIMFTGGQTSREGCIDRVAYSVAKSSIRILAQSMARELGPKGVHVAHIQLDAGVDNERTRKRDPDLGYNDGLVSTEAVADIYFYTHHQPRSCWSFDVEVRPWNTAF